MSREKHLSDDEKKTISFLYNISSWPVGKIARSIGRCRMSVNRYKNYELSLTTEIKRITAKPGECPECRSTNIKKRGFRKTFEGPKQRFECKDCGHSFVPNPTTSGWRKTKDVHTMYTQKETYDASKEQATFQRIYTDYKNNAWYQRPHSLVFRFIKDRYWKKISKWPKYKGMNRVDVINDVMDMLRKKHNSDV